MYAAQVIYANIFKTFNMKEWRNIHDIKIGLVEKPLCYIVQKPPKISI